MARRPSIFATSQSRRVRQPRDMCRRCRRWPGRERPLGGRSRLAARYLARVRTRVEAEDEPEIREPFGYSIVKGTKSSRPSR
jgi:hypothetical protein